MEIIPIMEMARAAGEYIGELSQYSPMRSILSARTILNSFIPAIKARARMNLRTIASEEDFKYVKEIFEQVYGDIR